MSLALTALPFLQQLALPLIAAPMLRVSGVSGVADVPTVATIVARLRQQYSAARQAALALPA